MRTNEAWVVCLVLCGLVVGCAAGPPGNPLVQRGFTVTELPRLAIDVTTRTDVEAALGAGSPLDGGRYVGYRLFVAKQDDDTGEDDRRPSLARGGRAAAVPDVSQATDERARRTGSAGYASYGSRSTRARVAEYSLVLAYARNDTVRRFAFTRIRP